MGWVFTVAWFGYNTRMNQHHLRVAGALISCVLISSCALFRVPEETGALQRAGEVAHQSTSWEIGPSYAHDAICFISALSGAEYYTELFADEPDAAFAAQMRASLTRSERRRVDRLYRLIHDRFGAVPAAVLSSLYSVTGAQSLAEFRAIIDDPRAFRASHPEELEAYYKFALSGWRLPGFLVDRVLRDVAVYVDAIERLGFRGYWETQVRPDLEELADSLSAGLADYNAVPTVERLIGMSVQDDRVRVYLTRFARPHGISLGATGFVMEERTDVPNLVRVAIHEMMHGWVDWTDDPVLSAWIDGLSRDPVVRAAYRKRSGDFGYNTYAALAEEGLVKALEQLGAEALGIPEPPLERFFFHDNGLHVVGLGLAEALRAAGYPENAREGESIQARLARLIESDLPEGEVGRIWNAAFGADRPGRLPERLTVARVHAAGDPALDAIHPSYNEAMEPGMVVVFLNEWLTASDADAAIAELERAGRALDVQLVTPEGAEIPLSYAFAGNWGTDRNGVSYFYRNAFYFRTPAGTIAPGTEAIDGYRVELY